MKTEKARSDTMGNMTPLRTWVAGPENGVLDARPAKSLTRPFPRTASSLPTSVKTDVKDGYRDSSYGRRISIICMALLLMISDCASYFGQGAFMLKYVALIIGSVLCIIDAARTPIPKVRFAPTMLGLIILISCIPFQTGVFSILQSIGLYLLLFIFATFSGSIFKTGNDLRIISTACSIIVLVLLSLSLNDCLNQITTSLAFGRMRMWGCFSHPNSLGNIAALVAIMLVSSIYLCETKRERSVILTIAMAGVVLLSGSRTALIMLISFVLFLAYYIWSDKQSERGIRTLLSLLFVLIVAIVAISSIQYLANDVAFMLRLDSLTKITFGGVQSLVGIGYVSSEDAAQVVSAAGGAAEMILVSMYYRVGLLGILAYALLFAGALRCGRAPDNKKDRVILFAFLASLLMQAIGESYLSSVMTFVSCFEWILMANLSMGLRSTCSAENVSLNNSERFEWSHLVARRKTNY